MCYDSSHEVQDKVECIIVSTLQTGNLMPSRVKRHVQGHPACADHQELNPFPYFLILGFCCSLLELQSARDK